MNIDATYKRAVHIIGKPGVTHPHTITISDALTGEGLTNIKGAIIYLDASEVSKVILFYYETNEQGNIVTDAQKEPIQGTTTIISEKHEVNVTAFEV